MGVIGALVLRAAMIAVGAQLLEQFHWILYVFAAFLIWTGYKLTQPEEEEALSPLPERLIRKVARVSNEFHGNALVRRDKLGTSADANGDCDCSYCDDGRNVRAGFDSGDFCGNS